MENLTTVADARDEKNFEDRLSDYKAKKIEEAKLEQIQWFEAKIEEEKQSIIDCVNQNLLSFIPAKVERIQNFQYEIWKLND